MTAAAGREWSRGRQIVMEEMRDVVQTGAIRRRDA